MAGGEGAKERRRLKRLQAAGGEAKPYSKNSVSENQRQSKQRPSHGKPLGTRNPFAKASKFGKPNPDDKKKNKVKKPKHLKRKLEQAAESDEQTKEQLQKELEDWERRKEIFSQQLKQPKRRRRGRQETSRAPKSFTAQSSPMQDDTSAEPPAAFPRNTAPPKKQDPPGSKVEEEEEAGNSSSDESSLKAPPAKEAKQPETNIPTAAKTNSIGSDESDSSSSDSDSDADDEEEPAARRQRGKRRRGRKDTAKKIEETREVEVAKAEHSNVSSASRSDKSPDENEAAAATKKRYCIGRKPVTDFTLGQTYSGKVVYVKPFGVFLDIGCHSDAFCHVSRLSDDYVESPDTLFKEGDAVEKVRVVEIDRKRKRITVSLQTEARIEDERASAEARKQRKESRASKKKSIPAKQPKTADRAHTVSHEEKQQPQQPNGFPVGKEISHQPTMEAKDPSQMTPAELKRARKLARRAARREQAGDDTPEKQ